MPAKRLRSGITAPGTASGIGHAAAGVEDTARFRGNAVLFSRSQTRGYINHPSLWHVSSWQGSALWPDHASHPGRQTGKPRGWNRPQHRLRQATRAGRHHTGRLPVVQATPLEPFDGTKDTGSSFCNLVEILLVF